MTTDARGSPPQLLGGTQQLADIIAKDPWRRLLASSRMLDSRELSFRDLGATRLASFQSLVRRYTLQIRYGCDNPNCTKPTCFSCVKRDTSKPLRRPTPIAARALAYHLASQDDPESGLCDIIDAPSQWIRPVELRDGRSNRIDHRSFLQNLYSTKVARTLNQFGRNGLASPESTAAGDNAPKIEAGFEYLTESGRETTIQSPPETGNAPSRPSTSQNTQIEVTLPSRSSKSSLVNGHPARKTAVLATRTPKSWEDPMPKKSLEDPNTALPTPNGSASPEERPPNGEWSQKVDIQISKKTPKQTHPRPSTRSGEKPGSSKDSRGDSWLYDRTKFTTTHLSYAIMEDLKRIALAERDSELQIHLPDSMPRYGSCKKRWSFVDECLHQCLSNPKTLIASFRNEMDTRLSLLPHIHPAKMNRAFQGWQEINGALIFDSLWQSLECLFVAPPELKIRKGAKGKDAKTLRLSQHNNASKATHHVSDEDAVHIIMICIHALTALIFREGDDWRTFLFRNLLANKQTLPDQFQYEPALRLATRLVRAISARQCFFEMHQNTIPSSTLKSPYSLVFMHITQCRTVFVLGKRGWDGVLMFSWRRWLDELCLKTWRGEHEVKRWDAFGSAAECLLCMSEIISENFMYNGDSLLAVTSLFRPKIDAVEIIASYSDRRDDPNMRHILQYPFFFSNDTLLTYFRALNFSNMSKHFTTAGNNFHIQERFKRHFLNHTWQRYLEEHYSVASSRYLTLDVRRSHVLEDTLNQLWGLEKRQLMLPLKVRMGKDEGEQGVDQGGVAQEFFRVALAEAFNPDNGMFTVDPQTHMAWFRPMSPEPLARFELIGLLFSIAICNGITLPVSFPMALYCRLTMRDRTTQFIADGWPEINQSLKFILNCKEEVGDILGRDYVFSIDAGGLLLNINMAATGPDYKLAPLSQILTYVEDVDPSALTSRNPTINWPPTNPDAPLVTNANRAAFVDDYKEWLTYRSIAPQLIAFTRGFDACLPPSHLALLRTRPSLLRDIVQGHLFVDTPALERVTRYDGGYSASHAVIRAFWAVVHAWDQDRKRKLLEFVTASDRVPVAGIGSLMFWIQRNGSDGEQLPTSSTCFGRLLLPQYETKEKLERKLIVALDNARGFGAA
ncbi:hypothetical protein IWZ01DRAFT_550819 [Phyllosticta capitalensis]